MARHNVRRLLILLLLLTGLIVSLIQVLKAGNNQKALSFATPLKSIRGNHGSKELGHAELGSDGNAGQYQSEDLLRHLGNAQGTLLHPAELEDPQASPEYREIFSLTTATRDFMPIHFGLLPGYNPNVIPHPTRHDAWIVVGQHANYGSLDSNAELACTAIIFDDKLICTTDARPMPITPNVPGKCEGDLLFINLVSGTRDARVFHGPEVPYIVYGQLSQYFCFGQWIQDARMLLDEYSVMRHTQLQFCARPLEIRRPQDSAITSRLVEKNHFIFWDGSGQPYVHYDLWPIRSFAQLDGNGAGMSELASHAASSDQKCMSEFLPKIIAASEDIHQATNSLSITMCPRASSKCALTDDNTFIMHIFHHKTFYNFHGTYEPYVVLFKRTFPFEIKAISQRPLWISGRKSLTAESDSVQYRENPGAIPEGQTEMFYVTSMSWKTHGQKYHGYTDDVLFINFGIEDSRGGVIDIHANDILQDLAYC